MKKLSKVFLYTVLLLPLIYSCSTTDNAGPNQQTPSESETPTSNSGDMDSEDSVPEPEINFNEFDAKAVDYLNGRNFPGMQIAITKSEKLVYYKSFGLSDLENEAPVEEKSLFRIASISKPITAVAILNLVKDGKISLNEKVFGTNGILKTDYEPYPYPETIESISIRNLLEHKSGWTNDPYDIMFDDNSLEFNDLISKMIERGLAYQPGSDYYYSNFGYCILGRVIEKVSDMSYEDYVRDTVLKPMGIMQMRIGGNTLEERFENEVMYYTDSRDFTPYDMNVTRMDSHGGWIASAKDLAKFMIHIDRSNSVQDILDSGLLSNNPYFGFSNWIHTGSLPGTSSLVERYNDEFNFAIVINKRNSNIEAIGNEMHNLVASEIQSRSEWPAIDLFVE